MSATYQSRFCIGERVEIDGDPNHIGVIVQVAFANTTPHGEYDVRTWVNGVEQRTWLDEFRLGPAR